MEVIKTGIPGVLIIEPEVHGDERGFFVETYNRERYLAAGIDACFVQDNVSRCEKAGTFRGLHYQCAPHAQAKLVSCSRGSVMDVVVDIRRGSPTYGRYEMALLSEQNHRQFFVPRGFAHGYLALEPGSEFTYKCDNIYDKASEGFLRLDDEKLGIDTKALFGDLTPIMLDRDRLAPDLEHCNANFIYGENC